MRVFLKILILLVLTFGAVSGARKRQFYSLEDKLDAFRYAEKHGVKKAARELLGDVELSRNVRRWKAQKVCI